MVRHKGTGLPMNFEVVGENGRLFLLNDAAESFLWRENDPSNIQRLELPGETEPWPAGKAMVEDLITAVESGGRTACDISQAIAATEIGFCRSPLIEAAGSENRTPRRNPLPPD